MAYTDGLSKMTRLILQGSGHEDLATGVFAENVEAIPGAGAVNDIYGSGSGLTAAGGQVLHQAKAGVQGMAEAEDLFDFSWGDGHWTRGAAAELRRRRRRPPRGALPLRSLARL